MHDEDAAIKEIQGLSENARAHLSHIIRNGLCSAKSAHKYDNRRFDEALNKLEGDVAKLGI